MTNSWTDIKNADVVWIMGGNAAEAHPCGFKWVTEAKAERGAKLMVVDPRFNRSAAMADHYAPIRSGSDIAFLSGVVNYLVSNDKIHKEYVRHYTNAAFIVKDEFEFNEGLFSGYDESKRSYDRSTWEYKFGPDGFAIRDMTLQDPRCVFQLMKKHFAQYTPELVERVCGTPKDKFLKVAEWVSSTANGERAMTIMYALGWTQHSHGAQNIRTAAMIQLLCGNIGIPGGGVNALRGHSNVQGITDVGTLTAAIPGYLALPTEQEPTLESHLSKRAFKPLTPNQTSYWQNYRKFYVSFLKTQFGASATKENEFGYNYLPKLDGIYDCIKMFDLMHQGKTNGLICQGFNPLMAIPNSNKSREALSKLKFLVSMDPIETDTVRFWENHGEFNNIDPAKVQTEVFMLPVTSFAEEEGSVTNSSRVIQWKWKAADPYFESRTDTEILSDLFVRMRKMYEKDGGKGKDAILAVDWSYKDPLHPSVDELLTELNGKALGDVKDGEGKVIRAAGQRLASFGEMRDKAMGARPDLKAAQVAERAAEANIVLQNALKIPNLTLSGGVEQVVAGGSNYNFGVGIALPTSDRNQGERAKALIDKRRAANQEQIITNQILSDVDKALIAVNVQKHRVDLYKSGVLTKVTNIQNATQEALKAGENSTLDLLDAIRTRRGTLADFYQAIFDYQSALLDLELATATTLPK